jgi:hypothetical protein
MTDFSRNIVDKNVKHNNYNSNNKSNQLAATMYAFLTSIVYGGKWSYDSRSGRCTPEQNMAKVHIK